LKKEGKGFIDLVWPSNLVGQCSRNNQTSNLWCNRVNRMW